MSLRSVTPVPDDVLRRAMLQGEHSWTIREIAGRVLWICDRDGCEVRAETRAVHRTAIFKAKARTGLVAGRPTSPPDP